MAPPVGSIPKAGEEHYFPYPASVFKLNRDLHIGMYPLGLIAVLSVLATTAMISYLIWQMVVTRNRKGYRLYQRQLYILYFNLLVADFLQALSFLFSFHWEAVDAILAPTGACWAQGWLLHLGDVASGMFVFLIAVHTSLSLVRWRREMTYGLFVLFVLLAWFFCLVMATLPPIIRGKKCYAKAAAWCWINVEFENDRLWSHYVWIFFFEFGTVFLYGAVAWKLRKHLRIFKAVSGQSSTLERQQKYMLIYPTIYVILTLPLAASRMWTMSHHGKAASDPVMIIAGCLITSCGWMDALMYSLTRNVLASRRVPQNQSTAYHNRGTNGTGPGLSRASERSRNRYFDDDCTNLTNLRSYDWDGDGDTTPPGTTTTISGGKDVKEVESNFRSFSRQSERKESSIPFPFVSRRSSAKKEKPAPQKDNLDRVSEGDEKELISSLHPELPFKLKKPKAAITAGSHPGSGRNTPGHVSPIQNPAFFPARGQSPASDETRVPSDREPYLPPGTPAFGQVKVETSVNITRTEPGE
ncbi:hypothetical protein NA57DRAFT_70241 [Rhizodiscina lignyota]|uniref:G-protein coupled receptors family 1 profile domain-containing protein n=1 Tax=Rhizodiscina lignyota TaxID=1504668 RepID=A0A9P4IT74_9PEZI|nr:hypothetical protein NA57DRAFT_70241 [Rhizodiscina lignyota]